MSPRPLERPRQHGRGNHPQSGAAATDRRCPVMATFTHRHRDEHGHPEQPGAAKDKRPTGDQPCRDSAPLLEKGQWPRAFLAPDANLIRKTPTTDEDAVLRRPTVTTEIETLEWAQPRD